MKNRTVSQLLYAEMKDMDGFPVRQAFPTQRVDQIDPFLLLHHADIKAPKHVKPDHAGVGPHPHRGFSPVTFIFKGGVHHRDSRGNDSVIYAGGAQWMNAGMGVIHSERPPKEIHEIGGRQEIVQLWINTPAAHKMDQPAYYPVSADEAPFFRSKDEKVLLKAFAGQLLGLKGPVPTHSEINAATLNIRTAGTLAIPVPQDHHTVIYILDGKLNVNGFGMVEKHHAVLFRNDGEGITLEGLEDSTVLVLSGKPLQEEVVSHGPFVMNTQTQILEAMRDYQMGKMGILIED
ncbi:MAG TPA: pirin family protein [Chryseolinea sp.]|nr:pirin family protein [Chryseolinea sp.]